MSVSMLGNDVKLKDKEREQLKKDMERFLKFKRNQIQKCPPLPPPSLPPPAKATYKATLNRKPKKQDTHKRVRLQGIEYNEKKRAMIDGHKFGKLMPMYVHEKRANDKQYIWACMCDCGQMIDVRTSLLTRGIITSCESCAPTMAEIVERNRARG